MCLKKFRLTQHIQREHEKVLQPCEQCDYTTYVPAKLKQHIKLAHSGPLPSCDLCGQTFRRKAGLQKHIKSVHENIRLVGIQVLAEINWMVWRVQQVKNRWLVCTVQFVKNIRLVCMHSSVSRGYEVGWYKRTVSLEYQGGMRSTVSRDIRSGMHRPAYNIRFLWMPTSNSQQYVGMHKSVK